MKIYSECTRVFWLKTDSIRSSKYLSLMGFSNINRNSPDSWLSINNWAFCVVINIILGLDALQLLCKFLHNCSPFITGIKWSTIYRSKVLFWASSNASSPFFAISTLWLCFFSNCWIVVNTWVLSSTIKIFKTQPLVFYLWKKCKPPHQHR